MLLQAAPLLQADPPGVHVGCARCGPRVPAGPRRASSNYGAIRPRPGDEVHVPKLERPRWVRLFFFAGPPQISPSRMQLDHVAIVQDVLAARSRRTSSTDGVERATGAAPEWDGEQIGPSPERRPEV